MYALRPSWHPHGESGGVRPKQTLFCSSGSEFAPNRPCFAPAGRSLSQTDPVLLQRVGVCPKQTLFCSSGSEFAPNRLCFTSAGRSLPQTDSVLHQRAGGRPKQTLFCTTECQRSKTKLLIVSAHNFYDASTHCIR